MSQAFLRMMILTPLFVFAQSSPEMTTKDTTANEFTMDEMLKKGFKRWENIITSGDSESKFFHFHYYDPEKNQLFSCAAWGNKSKCSIMDNSKAKNSFHESIEQKNNWKFVGVLLLGTNHHLIGPNPFEQWNAFSFYLSDKSPQYCRKTETSYNFTYNENGKYLVFKSDKQDESDLLCEPMQFTGDKD